jgi:hypothetical protein
MMAPGFAGLGRAGSRESEAGRRRARPGRQAPLEIDALARGEAWGDAESRISEFVDNVLLKAEERPIIAGMKNPTAASPATGHRSSAKLRRAHGVLQPERLARSGTKFLTPIARNPLKRLISKK